VAERKTPSNSGSGETAEELARLRAEIDDLDAQIVGLLNKRARLGLRAGKAKLRTGRPVADSEREREVLIRVAMANEGPFPQDALLAIYRQLIETIKRLEELDSTGPQGDGKKDPDD
jgi:chorismate mutase/prephenate dehydratase